jgi:non-ribosomal peptide synthetase component F
VPDAGAISEDEAYRQHACALAGAPADALQEVLRARRLTLNTAVLFAWALLLQHHGNSADVVFGATVSGRPPDLPGAESIMGLFINTLPVRAAVTPETSVAEAMAALQARQVRARQYDYTPLASIIGWSEVPRGQPLFETIVVFENNKGFDALEERYGDLAIVNVQPLIRNSLPLTLRAVPGETLAFQFLYDRRRHGDMQIAALGQRLEDLLTAIAEDPDQPVAALQARLVEADRRAGMEREAAFKAVGRARLDRARRRSASSDAAETGDP